jgi:drug/metabolite transporter (DMT)-like permease
MDARRIRGIALVLAASALWGASGPLTKILRGHGFGITDVLAWRYFLGLLSLFAFSRLLPRPPDLRIDAARFRSALVMALCIFGVNAAFTWSNFFTTVTHAIALSFTAPLFAALLGGLLLGERVSPAHRLAIAVGCGGVCVFAFGPALGQASAPTPLSPNIPLGDGLALLSGFLFGTYFVLARRFAQRSEDVVAGTIWQFLIVAGLLSPLLGLTLFKGIGATGYVALFAYSGLCTAAPILLLNLSGTYLAAHEASILALAEVPFSIAIGMLMVGEYPSPSSWVGAGLIVAAGLIGARDSREAPGARGREASMGDSA